MKIFYVILALTVIVLHLGISHVPKPRESEYVLELKRMLDNCGETRYTDNDCKYIKNVLARYEK